MTFPKVTAFGLGLGLDTLGGLMFLLAGHIPVQGECVIHPSGWRLEALDSDTRRILRVRLHAPETKA